MRFLLITHNAHNLGDVAIAEATIQHIRSIDPDAKIVLESNSPEISRRYFPDIEIIPRYFNNEGIRPTGRMMSLGFLKHNLSLVIKTLARVALLRLFSIVKYFIPEPQLLKQAAMADCVLSIAGDSISERYGYWLRFLEIDAISAINKNIVLYAQSIGPFSSSRAQTQARRSLSKCRLILARDKQTVDLLKSYGVSAPIEPVADAAISLVMNRTSEAKRIVREMSIGRGTVGLVIRTETLSKIGAKDYRDYIDSMTDAIEIIEQHGCRPMMTGTIPEDCAAGAALLERIARSDIRVLRLYDHKPSEAKYILSRMHSIISPRMHPVILATSVLTPALALVQEFKLRSYMERIGLAESILPLAGISRAELREKLLKLLRARDEYVANIELNLPVLQEQSLKSAKLLRQLMGL